MSQILAIVIAGFAIGVLAGMSATPVISTVLTAVLTVATSVVTVLAGLNKSETTAGIEARAWPVASLCGALLVGSLAGVYVRTSRFLASDPVRLIKPWTDVGIDRLVAAKRLFDITYPPSALGGKTNGEVDAEKPKPAADDKKPGSKHANNAPPPPMSNAWAQAYVYASEQNMSTCEELTSAPPAGKRLILEQQQSRFWIRIYSLVRAQADSELGKAIDDICFVQ